MRVTGVVDTRVYPWNGSGLPIDPIVELYSAAGVLLRRVDAQSESGTELVSAWLAGPGTIYVRVLELLRERKPRGVLGHAVLRRHRRADRHLAQSGARCGARAL